MNRRVMIVVTMALLGGACSGSGGGDGATSCVDSATPTTRHTAGASSTTTTVPPDVTGAEGLGDSFYPYLGNGGYDVLRYDIDINVDPAANTIEALTTITAQATRDLMTFNLDLSGLTVETVEVDGIEASFSRSAAELIIVPADTLADGTEFSTEVSYSGSPEPITDPGFSCLPLGWQSRDGVIYTASEPSGSMSWFPSNNHPTDKATFEIRITVPVPLTAAANGVLVDKVNADGLTTTTWRMDDPMATYLAAVYIGDFERVETNQPGSPLIRDYVPRGTPEIAGALSITPEVIGYFEDLLGPYPFDAYGTIVLPFELGYALENQTLSVHGRSSIDPLTIAHEISHQWFGNSSTLDDWSEIWLHEGFATYLSSMYMAERRQWDLDAQTAAWHGALSVSGSVPPNEIEIAEMFDDSVYLRGALTLHVLRGLVGDTLFADILRTHYQRSARSNTNTAEFLEVVQQLSGPESVELVESWLHDDPIPTL